MYKIFAAVLVICFALEVNAESGANIYAYPRDLPSKTLIGERGNHVKLSDFEGDFVIAIFWSRYCTPCLKEMRYIKTFIDETKHDGIRVIMISPKKEWTGGFDEQRRFLKKFGGEEFEIYVDDKSAITSALGIFTSPVAVLISRDAKEIGRIRGAVKWYSKDVIEYFYQLKSKN